MHASYSKHIIKILYIFIISEQLQTEIRIHRTLNHAHVVKFERYFEDINNAYILLELCHNNVSIRIKIAIIISALFYNH